MNSGPPFDMNSLNLNPAVSGGIVGVPGSTGAALANAASQLEQTISAGGLITSSHTSNSS